MAKANLGKGIFKQVNNYFSYLYKTLDSPISAISGRSHIYLYPELKKMNKMMRNYYKHSDLQITASDNLIPFRFETEDGAIIDAMQYITDIKSEKWIIASHWFAGNKYWALYWAKPFIALGYNILIYDFRNHGTSQKGYPVTMGYLEAKDLMGAIKWLGENKKVETLGLMGVSMGAFVTNYVVAKYPDLLKAANVKFAISDVTYGSIQTLLTHVRNVKYKSSSSKKKVKQVTDKIIETQSEATGLDWRDIDIFKYYEKLDSTGADIPTSFSHGANDKIAPVADTYRLFVDRSQRTDLDEIIVYDWSTHAVSLKQHHNKQIYHWLKFENKIVKDNKATTKALSEFEITEELMQANPEERKEIYTFTFNSSEEQPKKRK